MFHVAIFVHPQIKFYLLWKKSWMPSKKKIGAILSWLTESSWMLKQTKFQVLCLATDFPCDCASHWGPNPGRYLNLKISKIQWDVGFSQPRLHLDLSLLWFHFYQWNKVNKSLSNITYCNIKKKRYAIKHMKFSSLKAIFLMAIN